MGFLSTIYDIFSRWFPKLKAWQIIQMTFEYSLYIIKEINTENKYNSDLLNQTRISSSIIKITIFGSKNNKGINWLILKLATFNWPWEVKISYLGNIWQWKIHKLYYIILSFSMPGLSAGTPISKIQADIGLRKNWRKLGKWRNK